MQDNNPRGIATKRSSANALTTFGACCSSGGNDAWDIPARSIVVKPCVRVMKFSPSSLGMASATPSRFRLTT